jgi:hypothetical protein
MKNVSNHNNDQNEQLHEYVDGLVKHHHVEDYPRVE